MSLYKLGLHVDAPLTALAPAIAGDNSQWIASLASLGLTCVYDTVGNWSCQIIWDTGASGEVNQTITGTSSHTTFDVTVSWNGDFQYTGIRWDMVLTSDITIVVNGTTYTQPAISANSPGKLWLFIECFVSMCPHSAGTVNLGAHYTDFSKDGVLITGWNAIGPIAVETITPEQIIANITNIPVIAGVYQGITSYSGTWNGANGHPAWYTETGTFAGDGTSSTYSVIFNIIAEWVSTTPRTMVWMGIPNPTIAPNPSISFCNLIHSDGSYYKVARWFTGTTIEGLAIWRGDAGHARTGYPWDLAANHVTANPVDDNPCLAIDRGHRLYLVFDRQSSAGPPRVAPSYEMYSDDDGQTWSTPILMSIPGVQFPRIRVGADGSKMRLGYCDDGTGHSTGVIKGQYQAPGDPTPGAVFTCQKWTGTAMVNIAAQQGGVDMDLERDCSGRWIMTLLEVGKTASSDYVSADDGLSWVLVG